MASTTASSEEHKYYYLIIEEFVWVTSQVSTTVPHIEAQCGNYGTMQPTQIVMFPERILYEASHGRSLCRIVSNCGAVRRYGNSKQEGTSIGSYVRVYCCMYVQVRDLSSEVAGRISHACRAVM
jgi:hypothetical protein